MVKVIASVLELAAVCALVAAGFLIGTVQGLIVCAIAGLAYAHALEKVGRKSTQ